MTSFVKKIVAGPKKKTPYNGQQLDLTYITDRIIAMAYPASNFLQKVYRNSITDVANYFNQYHHNDFLIINVSSRPYDYSKFQGRVQQYEWPDHQAPPLTTLIEISFKAKMYLENNKTGVIAFHCNHGKGRTGTAIISFMLYMSLYTKSNEALAFYNSRRFSDQEYGVDQPCQTRYLNYIQNLIKMKKIPKKLIGYRLTNIIQNGLPNKYFVNIKKTRSGKQLVEKFPIGHYKSNGNLLMGDIFIQIFQQSWTGAKRISRINFNTFFLNPNNQLNIKELTAIFNSNQIKCSKSLENSFALKFEFQYYCLCHVEGSEGIQCPCNLERSSQQKYWVNMIEELDSIRKLDEKQSKTYFYFQSNGLQQCLKQQKTELSSNIIKADEFVQNMEGIYYLSKSMSKLQIGQCQQIGTILINKQLEMSSQFNPNFTKNISVGQYMVQKDL